jgi:pimeloyl-ACP methyl ester carboxylesterase
MKSFLKLFYISFIIVFCVLISYSQPALGASISNVEIKGIWQGTLKFNGGSIRVVFRISGHESGDLKAEMDSPDQGVKGLHVDIVNFDGSNLKLEVNIISAFYEGKYNPDSIAFDGNWHQSGLTLPLAIKRIDKVEEIKRPQEPKPPFPYKIEDVIYDNKTAGIKLGGTLTMPESGGPFAAVILIAGSGPNNRNEELSGHKLFLVLADYLTRKGIAVLRVDKRGIGVSTGNFAASTTKDFSKDVLTSIEYLKNRKEIDSKKIGLIGHSEGGIIAPMVASETHDVSFIVLMAGPGLPGDELLCLQSEALAKAEGYPVERIKESTEINKKMYNAIKTGGDSTKIAEALKKIYLDHYNNLDKKEKSEIRNPKAVFEGELKSIMSPWFRYFISYDPAPALEQVKCPMLALNGSKDLQVLPTENLAGIKKAMEKGGNKNFEVKELEGLNHLFQTAETGSPAEYMKIEETISPTALQTICDWILKIIKN